MPISANDLWGSMWHSIQIADITTIWYLHLSTGNLFIFSYKIGQLNRAILLTRYLRCAVWPDVEIKNARSHSIFYLNGCFPKKFKIDSFMVGEL